MAIEVKVPLLPESVSDATVSTWHKKAGDKVSRDENIVDLETDKVMLEVPAPSDGVLKEIKQQTGATVKAEEVIAVIDTTASADTKPAAAAAKTAAKPNEKTVTTRDEKEMKETKVEKVEVSKPSTKNEEKSSSNLSSLSPSARRAAAEKEQSAAKEASSKSAAANIHVIESGSREEKRVPMTRIRTRIAERLLNVTQNTAMLTTFNEINMAPVMDIRSRYKEKFEKKYKFEYLLLKKNLSVKRSEGFTAELF